MEKFRRPKGEVMKKMTICLWFDSQAEEAAKFYTSVFKNSKIGEIMHYPKATEAVSGKPAGSVMTVEFELDGNKFIGLNGGPLFKFNEAVSLMIMCQDQAEIDYYWEKLTEGGQELPCGWLKDKFGVVWQVAPEGVDKLLNGSEKAMAVFLKMKKIVIADLEKAAKG
jgi:predicted 3-demethylubiquinone-9 3-methyltransferase (glyoxalase superfamily)